MSCRAAVRRSLRGRIQGRSHLGGCVYQHCWPRVRFEWLLHALYRRSCCPCSSCWRLALQKNIDNDIGTKNNLVSVRKSDFEVFQALAKDSEDAINNAQKEYSQTIPTANPWEKVTGPPVLPPHLLQVILNKDTPLSVSAVDWPRCGGRFLTNVNAQHTRTVRADVAAGAQPCDAEPLVRAVHQRRRHGAERNAPVSQKVRDHIAVQAHIVEL